MSPLSKKQELELLERVFPHILPKFQEANDIVVSMLNFETSSEFRIVDLGCGFGELSERLLQVFPGSMVYGVENNSEILSRTSQRLTPFKERFIPVHADMGEMQWSHEVSMADAVVSSFALDYLPPEKHQETIKTAGKVLSRGGQWVSCEFCRALDDRINRLFHDLEISFVQNALQSGLVSQTEFEQLEQSQVLRKPHHVITTRSKMDWLQSCGFHNIDIPWKFLNLTVIGAYREKDQHDTAPL
jgi:tRNA (cmo5U34)-methyltransferase